MKKLKGVLLASLSLFLLACGANETDTQNSDSNEVSVGVVGEVSGEIWEDVANRLEEDGIMLEVVTFADYVQPNRALADGELDLNAFQHQAFLQEYVTDSGEALVPMGYTIISPMYIFSVDEIPDVASIPEGARVAVSNSPTSAERSFLGLEAIGLIELDDEAGFAPTIDDVTENHKDIEIMEVDPNQLSRALGDADIITIGGDMLADAGMDPAEAIYVDTEQVENIDPKKKNIIAVKEEDRDSEVLQRVVEEYQSSETAEKIEEISKGSSIPIWEDADTAYEDFQEIMSE